MNVSNSYKNMLILFVSTVLFGSIGFYLLLTYKLWPFSQKQCKNEINKLDEFVLKGTNIYLQRENQMEKEDVEKSCYSIMIILKSLTNDKSDELFDYLKEQKVKDINGFKNFITYLNSKLILENDENKIFRILKYFIDEKSLISNFILDTNESEKVKQLQNDKYRLDLWYKDHKFYSDLSEAKRQLMIEAETQRKKILENKLISENLVKRILELENNDNSKDNENDKVLDNIYFTINDLSLLLENITTKFLIRDFYEPTIYEDLQKLVPDYQQQIGNPFLAEANICDLENQNEVEELKISKTVLDKPNESEKETIFQEVVSKTESLSELNDNNVDSDSQKNSSDNENVKGKEDDKYKDNTQSYDASEVIKDNSILALNDVEKLEDIKDKEKSKSSNVVENIKDESILDFDDVENLKAKEYDEINKNTTQSRESEQIIKDDKALNSDVMENLKVKEDNQPKENIQINDVFENLKDDKSLDSKELQSLENLNDDDAKENAQSINVLKIIENDKALDAKDLKKLENQNDNVNFAIDDKLNEALKFANEKSEDEKGILNITNAFVEKEKIEILSENTMEYQTEKLALKAEQSLHGVLTDKLSEDVQSIDAVEFHSNLDKNKMPLKEAVSDVKNVVRKKSKKAKNRSR